MGKSVSDNINTIRKDTHCSKEYLVTNVSGEVRYDYCVKWIWFNS